MVEFQEVDFSKEGDLSYKLIVLRQIERIARLACGELTKSYWVETPVKVGTSIMMKKQRHEDKRLAFCEATELLTYLIEPYSDTAFKTEIKKIDVEEKEIDKKLLIKKKAFAEIMRLIQRTGFFEGSILMEGVDTK